MHSSLKCLFTPATYHMPVHDQLSLLTQAHKPSGHQAGCEQVL